MSDRVELSISTVPDLRGVASLVLGGVGSRHDLPYERVDDLQIAVLSALEAVREPAVTLDVEVGDGRMSVYLGPLERKIGADPALARVLDRLVDEVEDAPRNGRPWLGLHLELPVERDQPTAG